MTDMTIIKVPKKLLRRIKMLATKEGIPMYKYLDAIIKKEEQNETTCK